MRKIYVMPLLKRRDKAIVDYYMKTRLLLNIRAYKIMPIEWHASTFPWNIKRKKR